MQRSGGFWLRRVQVLIVIGPLSALATWALMQLGPDPIVVETHLPPAADWSVQWLGSLADRPSGGGIENSATVSLITQWDE